MGDELVSNKNAGSGESCVISHQNFFVFHFFVQKIRDFLGLDLQSKAYCFVTRMDWLVWEIWRPQTISLDRFCPIVKWFFPKAPSWLENSKDKKILDRNLIANQTQICFFVSTKWCRFWFDQGRAHKNNRTSPANHKSAALIGKQSSLVEVFAI